uniref:AIG1-type G domain-containing protein n=1 Tax=Oncorhynchus kisutch TaxID=8019 RepID=A0A8C7CWR0_ONCKI
LLLLGRVGAGKSTVAKTILGRENFRSEGGMCVKKQGEVAGRTVTVVDTPGWDTVKYTSTHIKQEIKNSVTLCPPGPHALLLVVPMGDPLSSAERKAIRYHMELLSVRAWKFTMVLFVSEAEEKCTSIEQNQMIDRAKSILVKCGDRHHLLECGHSPQISELLKKIDAMVAENSVAGAEHGTLGACTGIPIGIILAVLVSYAVRGAATAARDISITVKAEENESQRRAERAGFFLDSPKSKRFDKDQ